MAELSGNEILARCLKAQGVKDLFFIMGGPMLDAEMCCIKEGIRLIDTRHEQGASYMAQAYSRVTQGPGVCMAASGPATLNFGTGLANSLIDCCPVVAIGGSSPISQFGRQVFQEIDQVKSLEGQVKYADRVHNLKRIPQQVNFAFQTALLGKPGPVYLDFPGDVLYSKVEEDQVDWSYMGRPILKPRPYAEPKAINALVDAIKQARQPIICSGSGVLWSHAWEEMRQFVDKAGIPFYTTPQGRGVVPDDHPYSYLTMRSNAFQEADLIIVLGTRMNYVIAHAAPPRFNKDAKIARIEIDAEELGRSARNVDIPVMGDCKSVLQQLIDAVDDKTADRVDQLLQYALAVAHHGDIDIAGGAAELLGIDLDARDLRVLVEARRRRMRDDVIHPGAENDDQIGFLECVRAHRQVRIRVIVGHDATALRGRIEWDAGLINELPHLFPGVRPQHAAPGADDRLPRLLDRIDESVDRLRFGIGPRLQDRPAHIAPIDLVFLHLGVEDVAGKIEINGPRLAKQRGLEREIHLLRNALQIVHAVGIFHLAFEAFDLIDLLEDLAAELADRARSADRDDRTAIDQRVGEAGAEIECRRTAGRHADARPLCHS